MALLTIGTKVVDVADVALVAPRGSVSQVYLADGSELSSALTAAAQATAVNGTAAGTQLTTVVVSSNFGSCYISGQNTQRVDTDAAGTGTIWFLRGGPGPVVCPATNLAAAQVLINATAAGVPTVASTTYVPVMTTNNADVTALTLAGLGLGVLRSGDGTAGDTYQVYGSLSITNADAAPVATAAITIPLPPGVTLTLPLGGSIVYDNNTVLLNGDWTLNGGFDAIVVTVLNLPVGASAAQINIVGQIP